GVRSLSVPDRATMANMAPEYGATMGFFAVDEKTVEYLRGTGREQAEIEAFESYFRAQGLFGTPARGTIDYSQTLTRDLSTAAPGARGPDAPGDPHGDGQPLPPLRRAADNAGGQQRLQPLA